MTSRSKYQVIILPFSKTMLKIGEIENYEYDLKVLDFIITKFYNFLFTVMILKIIYVATATMQFTTEVMNELARIVVCNTSLCL